MPSPSENPLERLITEFAIPDTFGTLADVQKVAQVSRAVCLILSDYDGELGTGVLVAPCLVLTNYHVVSAVSATGDIADKAAKLTFRFGYFGKYQGGKLFRVDPKQPLLAYSEDLELDYALLQLAEDPTDEQGALIPPLTIVYDRVLQKDKPVWLIQHPQGQALKFAKGKISFVGEQNNRFQYTANTLAGSSGSPVFDEYWNLVGLHHAGAPFPHSADIPNKGNEGILLQAIWAEIKGHIAKAVADHQSPTTPRRERQQPELHQAYLRKLVEDIGTVRLSLISPERAKDSHLEAVYVDSPTTLGISLEVKGGKVVEWWLSRSDQPKREREMLGEKGVEQEQTRLRPEQLGYDRAALEVLVNEYWQDRDDEDEVDEEDDEEEDSEIEIEENAFTLQLNELAATHKRLVVVGAPGSGKSSFVRYLALCLAGAGLDTWQRKASLTNLSNWRHGVLTPIYIELRRFVASPHFPQNIKEGATEQHLWDYIEAELQKNKLSGYGADLRYDLEHGAAVLLLDGLDEVPYPEGKLKDRQAQIIKLASSLETHCSPSRIIVTSRPYAYEGWELAGYERVQISPFGDKERITLATRLYLAGGESAELAEGYAKSLNEQLEEKIDEELKDRPLFVTLMASLYLNGLKAGKEGLPTGRGALYRESILLLLDRWTQSKPELGERSLVEILGDKSKEDLYVRLASLAYEVHNNEDRVAGQTTVLPDIAYAQLAKHFRPLGRQLRPLELALYLCENAGVLVSPGQDEEAEVFQFAHRTFQEYLAAEYLVSLCQKADSYVPLREHIISKPENWRIPGAFVGDILSDKGNKRELWSLLGDLLEEAPPESSEDKRWWSGWLGAKIAQEQGLYAQEKYHPRTEQPIKAGLVEWLEVLLATAQALKPVERAECGRVLSLLGDTREGVGVKRQVAAGRTVELPDIFWCTIPAPAGGKFVMGSKDEDDNPRRKVKLGYSFSMSKYQITYQQYQTFIDSEEYAKAEWWVDFPEEYQPQPMREQNNEYANHPRERVSWYQAVAFTRWLTAQYQGAGLIGAGEVLRLPTEEEWEYAARGTDERVYPYGNEFESSKGNTDETGIGMTSAVGSYPDGLSPFGVLDMSGNVWEWCLNKHDNPEEVEIDSSEATRVLRGGSFDSDSNYAACAYRHSNGPHYISGYDGFRVVVVAPVSASAL